jgi:hypothetical protein
VRLAIALAVTLVTASSASALGETAFRANGVRLVAPRGWHRVAATPTSISDPRTLLVVGTAGVEPNLRSVCQIAAYSIPATGAVVVVVGWNGPKPSASTGRAPLDRLRSVKRPSFECFTGRGAGTQVVLGGRVFQVNVMVGGRASGAQVAAALAVARSFDRAH